MGLGGFLRRRLLGVSGISQTVDDGSRVGLSKRIFGSVKRRLRVLDYNKVIITAAKTYEYG
jgi:hypothetical protein